jgi:hypothetical protein
MENATNLLNVLRKITFKLYISVLAMNNVLFKCLLYQNVSITFVYTASAALQQERVCDSFFHLKAENKIYLFRNIFF